MILYLLTWLCEWECLCMFLFGHSLGRPHSWLLFCQPRIHQWPHCLCVFFFSFVAMINLSSIILVITLPTNDYLKKMWTIICDLFVASHLRLSSYSILLFCLSVSISSHVTKKHTCFSAVLFLFPHQLLWFTRGEDFNKVLQIFTQKSINMTMNSKKYFYYLNQSLFSLSFLLFQC